jgi:S-adenosylmethionine uptake transporter
VNIVWMIVSGLLLTAMGVCVKLAGNHFGLGHTVLARGLVPALLIGSWIFFCRHTLRTVHWRSTAGAIGMLLYFTAIPRLPLATAVTLNNTSALFMAIAMCFRRSVPVAAVLALVAGFVGVALVLRPTLGGEQWVWGMVGLASGLMACIAQLNLHELGRAGEPEWRTVFLFSSTCSLFAIPFALAMPQAAASTTNIGPHHYALLGSIGLLGGSAQLALSRAFSIGHPLMNASLTYLSVVFSSLVGIPLWGDTLSPLSWLGMAIIIGAGIVSSHPATWKQSRGF